MSSIACRTALSPRVARPGFWTRFRRALGFSGTLDVESLPDHVKRDLGLIGGRTAPPRDLLRD